MEKIRDKISKEKKIFKLINCNKRENKREKNRNQLVEKQYLK